MADTIDLLNENVPTDVNLLSDIPPDIRGTKKALKGTFADLGASGGVVSVSAVELNHMAGVTSGVQSQIDAKPQPILWTLRSVADFIATPIERYLLDVETRNMVVFQNYGPNTVLQCFLPDKTAASDGDICDLQSGIIASSGEFKLNGFNDEPFRFLVNNSFDPAFNTWVDAFEVEFINPIPWPGFLITFSSTYDRWIVRITNQTVANSYQ